MASIRFSEEYPCGNGSGVYTRLHSPHRYRWLPEGLNPALYCFSLAWHLGHFILRFYSVSDFGHSLIKVISRSSIISVFEKPRFRDFASALPPHDKEFLSRGLEVLLHGNEQTGFEMILDLFKTGKLAKWSLMTVCQTYFHPQRDVFVKPTTVKGVIKYFELK